MQHKFDGQKQPTESENEEFFFLISTNVRVCRAEETKFFELRVCTLDRLQN